MGLPCPTQTFLTKKVVAWRPPILLRSCNTSCQAAATAAALFRSVIRTVPTAILVAFPLAGIRPALQTTGLRPASPRFRSALPAAGLRSGPAWLRSSPTTIRAAFRSTGLRPACPGLRTTIPTAWLRAGPAWLRSSPTAVLQPARRLGSVKVRSRIRLRSAEGSTSIIGQEVPTAAVGRPGSGSAEVPGRTAVIRAAIGAVRATGLAPAFIGSPAVIGPTAASGR